MPGKKRIPKVQTTLRLPRPLYQQARSLVEKGVSSAESLNDFIVAAIEAYVNALRRRRIDAAFRRMAEDTHYQEEAQLIAEEFERSDWEALEATEEDTGDADAAR